MCQCVDGSSEHHGRCHQSPGGRCTFGETCVGGSSCEFGHCRCPDGQSIDAGKCVASTSEPGKICQNGQKCVHGSVCRFGMCICVAKFLASKGRCVRRESVLVHSLPSNVPPPVSVGTVKGPGFRCFEKDLCSGGSRCTEGFCVCDELEVIINGQCVGSHKKANEIVNRLLVAAPGQLCEARTRCTGGSACMNRVCTCEQGAIDGSGRCSEVKKEHITYLTSPKKSPDQFQPGSACALTTECPYRTECLRGVCRCKKGETIVDNMCRKAIHQVFPGGKCDPRRGYDCVGEAHCFYGVCTCTRHLINSDKECATSSEMEMVLPGKRCGPGQSCTGGAVCRDGVCRCGEDEVPDVNKKCVKKSRVFPVFNRLPYPSTTISGYLPNPIYLASSAAPSTDRMSELEAFEALLKANPSLSAADEKTAHTIFGHSCRGNDECPANAFCFQQLCRCMVGYRVSGGYCEPISADCSGPSVERGRSCSQLAHPGEDCTKGQVCSFNSYCGLFSGVCECPSGMATTSERCERTAAAPGLGCVTSRNCYGFSYCDNGLCLCRTGYELNDNFCLPVLKSPSEIVTGVSSRNMKEAYPQRVAGPSQSFQSFPSVADIVPLDFTKPPFNLPTTPEVKAVYGPDSRQIRMQQALQMQASLENPIYSSFPIPFAEGASIKSGDVASEVTKTPLKLKVSMPGDFCGDVSICIGNSLCQKQFCRCPANTFAENGSCSIRKRMNPNPKHNNDEVALSQEESVEDRQFAAPLENCQNFEFCTSGSECSNIQGMGLVCQCPTNMIFLEDECVDVPRNVNLAGIGESCRSGEICLGGSKCMQNICMCDENRHDILGICVTTARPGDDCSGGQICVDGAICAASVKTCVCPPGRTSKLGRCLEDGHSMDLPKASNPGSVCDTRSICKDNSFCSAEGVCLCLPKFELHNQRCIPSAMIKQPGQECHAGDICSSGSKCRGNTCACPSGQLPIEGDCVRVTNEVRKKPVRQECDSDSECSDHYQCIDQVCVCHGTFSHCLQLALVGAEVSCQEDTQCPEHATCTESVCLCAHGYKMIGQFCVPPDVHRRNAQGAKTVDVEISVARGAVPGASCSEWNYCVMGSVCFKGYCICGIESVPKDGACVARSGNIGVGEHCSSVYRCRNGLACEVNRCACPTADVSCNGVFA